MCLINDQTSPDRKNLVALIKVPLSYLTDSKENKQQQWFLFNDFSICPVPAQEAVWFSLDWKVPCVLYYSTRDVMDSTSEIVLSLTKVGRSGENSIQKLISINFRTFSLKTNA